MVTQAERVYNHLLWHGSITNAQAHEMFGYRHLPAIIRDIKDKFKVEFTEEWQTGCNRYGDPVRWKKYILKKKEDYKYWEYDK